MTTAGVSRRVVLGRSREIATAVVARDSARAGLGGVLAFTGPAGVGKTWLCKTIADASADDGFRVGWGSCWPGPGAPQLWPWRQALNALTGDPAAETFDDLFDVLPDIGSDAWFELGVAVVARLREITIGQPSVVVIDDAHAADEQTRQLAYFVARHVRGLRLVLIVAYQPCAGLTELEREATAVTLHGFDAPEVATVLAARGIDGLADVDLTFLAEATGGLPLELDRLANAANDAPGVVRALVDQRLAALGTDLRYGAACAAIIDTAPQLREVAAVADDADIDPLTVAVELERLGLAARQPPDILAFRHEEVRAALVATLHPDELLEVHSRAARRLIGGHPSTTEGLQRRARHALAAAPRSGTDARFAMEMAREAADALVAANDPERAAGLLTSAEATHTTAGLGRPPAAFLAAQAGAVQRCGQLARARDLFSRAAAAADHEGDATSLALAALGLGGVWLAEHRSAIDHERVLALQRRARDGLPEEEARLRLRLDVRLAAERAYATGDLREIEAHIAAARALGDPWVAAEALSLYHHAILGPRHRDLRLAVAHEMLSNATQADDRSLMLMALLWLTSDLFLAGSSDAGRALAELHQQADAMGGRHAAYIASVMDTMVLLRTGRLDEAERSANAAFVLGQQIGDADAVAYYGAQLTALRWMQGRSAEVLELAAATAASPTITPPNRAFVAVYASLAADCDELDQARAALTRLRGQLGSILHSSVWLATLFATIEAAFVVGDAEIAREAADLLAPYSDLPVIASLGATCVGSARRSLGLAALTVGDVDRGIALLEAAIADNERLGHRPMAARTAADLAMARAGRGSAGDHTAAVEQLDRAIREADAMGMSVRAEQWRDRRTIVGETRGADSREPPSAARADQRVGVITRHGPSWMLVAAGREVVVPDLLGMSYLTQLLTNPGVQIAAVSLAAEGSEVSSVMAVRPEQPMLDDAALTAYRQRVSELEDDLAEAELHADSERAARARIELDAVVDELARTTNVFGRARPFPSSNELARTAVQKALRRVFEHIEATDPTLGTALRQSVQTGRTCCYQPAPGAPARWELHPSDHPL